MANHLQYEKSPYLLQHKFNPVNWFPWSDTAFEQARQEDKPIFLSIGYSTCHWCHVMAHESFEDPGVAKAINQSFVAIKVDREERPDVDGVYMSACVAMTGEGGWPLTVLMTPDQKPFWAGTYLPKRTLLHLLWQVEKLWREDREQLLAAGDELTAHLRKEESAQPGVPKIELLKKAVSQYTHLFDNVWGGFGSAPKFPTPHNLIFLLRYARNTGDSTTQSMAEQTLDAMYRGGIFDHIGGGFSRYATDRRWLIPHFEKMLYDNALLLYTYAEAYQQAGRPLYATVARRIATYVLRELTAPQGGFYCGQDADSEGVEGKYYVFTPEELRSVLGSETVQSFCQYYGIDTQGNFEGKSIPNRIGHQEPELETERWEEAREQVYHYRLQRTVLHKDDKILAAWNGLMIAALAKAAWVLDEPSYLNAAMGAANFVERYLHNKNGKLLARWREGEAAFEGKLDDYAFLAWGYLELYGATFRLEFLEKVQQLALEMLERFFDPQLGGLYPYASDGEQLLTRCKEVYDGAMPSGNAVAALIFSRLSRLTGETCWRETAELQLSYLAGAVERYPAGHSFTLLAMLEELFPSGELLCTCNAPSSELLSLLRQKAPASLSVLMKTPENQERLAVLAPFTAAYPMRQEEPCYYLCHKGSCRQPTSNLEELEQTMNALR